MDEKKGSCSRIPRITPNMLANKKIKGVIILGIFILFGILPIYVITNLYKLDNEYPVISFTDGNNNYYYPISVVTPENLEVDEIAIIYSPFRSLWMPEHRIAGMRSIDAPELYNKWDWSLELARSYYEFGDYYNSLIVYNNVYNNAGIATYSKENLDNYIVLLLTKQDYQILNELANSEYLNAREQMYYKCIIEIKIKNYFLAAYYFVQYNIENFQSNRSDPT